MTREELKKEIGLLLERFEENPTDDMCIYIDKIVGITDSFIKTELINGRKKTITDYLERALAKV